MKEGIRINDNENDNQNFPVMVDGKIYWISRAVAVAGFVFKKFNGRIHILANKRGNGTPDFQGYWNCPCGYLDRDESGEEAISREVLEECGFVVDSKKWKQLETQTDPSTNKQNVTIRYLCILDENDDNTFDLLKRKGGEKDEVDEVKWIALEDINLYKWAFEHDKLIGVFALKYVLSEQEIMNLM